MTTSTKVEDADIASLLERVTAATGPDRELDLALAQALVPDVIVLRRNDDDTANEPHTHWEYTSSIDAALALVERMLPIGPMVAHELRHSLARDGEEYWNFRIKVYSDDEGEYPAVNWGTAWTAPLAILAALLKALRSLSQGAGHEQ